MRVSSYQKQKIHIYVIAFCIFFPVFLNLSGCGGPTSTSYQKKYSFKYKKPRALGYTVQVGAFTDLNNAVRVVESLQNRGLDAYYFIYRDKLFKVRFGDYVSEDFARQQAEILKMRGIIGDFYIVNPQDYPLSKEQKYGRSYLRESLVKTAKSFIGVPYRWGGSSSKRGFDCSGLTMTVYKLNGIKLSRSSREQFKEGIPVNRMSLQKGDLVFFATNGGRRVSHVGIYAGNGSFIHAPSKGKKVRTESLYKRYYKKRYLGARRFL